MPQAVAERYARALADVVEKEGNYATAAQELEAFAGVYRESGELREVFDSPAIKPEQKLRVLNAIIERLGTSRVTANFLRVLLRHYRVNLVEEIRAAFQGIANDRLDIAEMSVISASPLGGPEKAALSRRFAVLTGKQVEITFSADPALIGGVVARIKSTVYDGSVRGALDEMQQQIAAVV
ncbi:MAG: ATP synthase F1 subunit delta [Terriglobia bacterium]